MSKKSYMDRENIITEGFFSKLFNFLKTDKNKQKDIKNNKKVKSNLKSLNRSVSDLENLLSKQYGKKVKLDKFNLSDFV